MTYPNLARELAPPIISAILFDMDGMLVDSRAAVERTWRRWTGRHGLDLQSVLEAAHGRRTHDTVRMFCPAGFDAELEANELVANEVADLDGIVAVAGASKLLAALPADRWCVVTSASTELARHRLAASGLPTPSVLVTAEAVLHGKPNPEGYLLAANLLGVDNRKCLVVEDAPAGIEAGIAAGASILVINGAQPEPTRAAAGHPNVRDFTAITLRVLPIGLQLSIIPTEA